MMADIMKYWPILVVAAGVVGSSAVDTFRINANADEIADQSESIDQNEEDIEEIQRLLIRRQGEVENKLQRVEIEQMQQGEDLEKMLRLMEQLVRQGQ